jgi:hypothetical protein
MMHFRISEHNKSVLNYNGHQNTFKINHFSMYETKTKSKNIDSMLEYHLKEYAIDNLTTQYGTCYQVWRMCEDKIY